MELDAFVPPLIRLCTRANKINVQRATQCLLQMVRSHPQSYRQIPRLAECMRTGQNKSQRYSVIQALAEMLQLHEWRPLEDYCADIEASLRMGLTDAESTVREVSRGAYQRYKDMFPQRTDAFESSLPPSTRKYLSVQQKAPVERKPIVAVRRAQSMKEPASSASSTTSLTANLSTSEKAQQPRPATVTSSLPPKTPQRLHSMPIRMTTPAATEESQHHFGNFNGSGAMGGQQHFGGGGAARAAPPQRLPFSQMKAQRILPTSRMGEERKDTPNAAAAAMLLPKGAQRMFPSRSISMDKLDVAASSSSVGGVLDSVRSTPGKDHHMDYVL